MADPKTYVQVNTFAIKEIFDSKHKSRVQALMTKTAEQAVKGSSKLTLDAPKEKGAKGWSLDSSLVSLGPDKAGKKFGANVSMSISTWHMSCPPSTATPANCSRSFSICFSTPAMRWSRAAFSKWKRVRLKTA